MELTRVARNLGNIRLLSLSGISGGYSFARRILEKYHLEEEYGFPPASFVYPASESCEQAWSQVEVLVRILYTMNHFQTFSFSNSYEKRYYQTLCKQWNQALVRLEPLRSVFPIVEELKHLYHEIQNDYGEIQNHQKQNWDFREKQESFGILEKYGRIQMISRRDMFQEKTAGRPGLTAGFDEDSSHYGNPEKNAEVPEIVWNRLDVLMSQMILQHGFHSSTELPHNLADRHVREYKRWIEETWEREEAVREQVHKVFVREAKRERALKAWEKKWAAEEAARESAIRVQEQQWAEEEAVRGRKSRVREEKWAAEEAVWERESRVRKEKRTAEEAEWERESKAREQKRAAEEAVRERESRVREQKWAAEEAARERESRVREQRRMAEEAARERESGVREQKRTAEEAARERESRVREQKRTAEEAARERESRIQEQKRTAEEAARERESRVQEQKRASEEAARERESRVREQKRTAEEAVRERESRVQAQKWASETVARENAVRVQEQKQTSEEAVRERESRVREQKRASEEAIRENAVRVREQKRASEETARESESRVREQKWASEEAARENAVRVQEQKRTPEEAVRENESRVQEPKRAAEKVAQKRELRVRDQKRGSEEAEQEKTSRTQEEELAAEGAEQERALRGQEKKWMAEEDALENISRVREQERAAEGEENEIAIKKAADKENVFEEQKEDTARDKTRRTIGAEGEGGKSAELNERNTRAESKIRIESETRAESEIRIESETTAKEQIQREWRIWRIFALIQEQKKSQSQRFVAGNQIQTGIHARAEQKSWGGKGRGADAFLWESQQARQFFWRVQRAPKIEQQLIFAVSGVSSLLAFSKLLRKLGKHQWTEYVRKLQDRIQAIAEDQDFLRLVSIPEHHLKANEDEKTAIFRLRQWFLENQQETIEKESIWMEKKSLLTLLERKILKKEWLQSENTKDSYRTQEQNRQKELEIFRRLLRKSEVLSGYIEWENEEPSVVLENKIKQMGEKDWQLWKNRFRTVLEDPKASVESVEAFLFTGSIEPDGMDISEAIRKREWYQTVMEAVSYLDRTEWSRLKEEIVTSEDFPNFSVVFSWLSQKGADIREEKRKFIEILSKQMEKTEEIHTVLMRETGSETGQERNEDLTEILEPSFVDLNLDSRSLAHGQMSLQQQFHQRKQQAQKQEIQILLHKAVKKWNQLIEERENRIWFPIGGWRKKPMEWMIVRREWEQKQNWFGAEAALQEMERLRSQRIYVTSESVLSAGMADEVRRTGPDLIVFSGMGNGPGSKPSGLDTASKSSLPQEIRTEIVRQVKEQTDIPIITKDTRRQELESGELRSETEKLRKQLEQQQKELEQRTLPNPAKISRNILRKLEGRIKLDRMRHGL